MEWNPDLDITNDGGCVVTGLTGSNDGDVSGFHGYRDYWVVKLNASGEIQWEKAYGGTNCDDGYAVRQTGDGGFILAGGTCSSDGDVGSIHSYDAGDFWIVKLGPTLTETVVPGKTALLEIFPNPTAGLFQNLKEYSGANIVCHGYQYFR